MGLFDFDFSAVERMFNSMSDEEKEKVMDTASQMMGRMNTEAMAQTAQEIQEEEEEISMEDYLCLDDDLLKALPSAAVEAFEAAVDLERYYEDVDEADQSGAALFYAKAVLALLRNRLAKRFAAVDPAFEHPAMTTLFQYVQACSKPQSAADLEAASIDVSFLSASLLQVLLFLQRAEYDRLSRQELALLKDVLFDQNLVRMLAFLPDAMDPDTPAEPTDNAQPADEARPAKDHPTESE